MGESSQAGNGHVTTSLANVDAQSASIISKL